MVDLVIGFGTGRCGTSSFARFLDKQSGINAAHEFVYLPWDVNIRQFHHNLLHLLMEKGGISAREIVRHIGFGTAISEPNTIVADIAWYWLNYIDFLHEFFPDFKAICLKRNRAETVESWMYKSTPISNYWTREDSQHWDNRWLFRGSMEFFPQYDLPKEEAIGRYWDDYYSKSKKLSVKYPENIIFSEFPQFLNDETEQKRILSFIGLPEGRHVYDTGIHRAKGTYMDFSIATLRHDILNSENRRS